jgi:DNA-binding CsgD family transcriptional regulator
MRPDAAQIYRLLGDVRDCKTSIAERQLCAVQGLCKIVGASQAAASRWSGFSATGRLTLSSFQIDQLGQPCDHVLAPWFTVVQGNFHSDPILSRAVTIPETTAVRTRAELISMPDWERAKIFELLPACRRSPDLLGGFYRFDTPEGAESIILYRFRGERTFSRRDARLLQLFLDELRLLHIDWKLGPLEYLASPLSPQRRHIVTLLAHGESVKQIAAAMGLTYHTVESYLKAIRKAFGVSTNTELISLFLGRFKSCPVPSEIVPGVP